MTTQNIGLFKALSAKMHYLNQRQEVLSQNIANADTPGYRPLDLKPVDFRAVLRSVDETPVSLPVRTNKLHLSPYSDIMSPESAPMKKPYDVEPSGNAVALEEQMIKSSQTQVDYNLMTSLYQKNVNMMRMALGRAQ